MMFSQDYLNSRFRYDAVTGILYYRPALPSHFKTPRGYAIWMGKFPGKPAGCKEIKRSGSCAYLTVTLDGVNMGVHRVIWAMINGPTDLIIDHINGDGLDNRIENLRAVTNAVNLRNQSMRASNTSGVMGVCFRRKCGKWRSEIGVNGKRINLGQYDSIDDAIAVRRSAEKRYGFHPNHGREKSPAIHG